MKSKVNIINRLKYKRIYTEIDNLINNLCFILNAVITLSCLLTRLLIVFGFVDEQKHTDCIYKLYHTMC